MYIIDPQDIIRCPECQYHWKFPGPQFKTQMVQIAKTRGFDLFELLRRYMIDYHIKGHP
jgi:hypothetical protein